MRQKKHTQHGMSKCREYRNWASMLSRCRNPKDPGYKHYGGRGICVCEQWLEFNNFIHDMGSKPALNYTIDRINTHGNYEPSNCRWATRKEQANNTITNRLIAFEGRTQTMTQWAAEYRMSKSQLMHRLNVGWSVAKALYTPYCRGKGKRTEILFTINNETLCLSDWARRFHIGKNLIYARIKRGWDTKTAIITPPVSLSVGAQRANVKRWHNK